MSSPQPQPLQPAWVRLHLERQSESSSMPASIVGLLVEEKPGSYVLSKTIEYKEDSDSYDVIPVEVPMLMLVSRTYVWACEILGELPTSEVYKGEGGMG